MAYRYEKNLNGEQDLVIDGWEKGIAESPYLGIANMRNWNVSYYPGVAYVNYKRQAATISGGSMKKPKHYAVSPAGLIYVIDSSGQIWKQSAVNSTTFNLLGSSPTSGASGQGIAFWNNYLFVFRGTFIDICGDGTGDSGVTSSNWNPSSTLLWPLGNATTMIMTGSLSAGNVSATISSYNDAGGAPQTSWIYPTGTYQMTLSNGQAVDAVFTYASTSVTFSPAVASGGASATITSIAGVISSDHMSYISANDGNLYFCNGAFIASLSRVQNTTFSPTNANSVVFNYKAVSVPSGQNAVWITELKHNIIFADSFHLYTWDFTTTVPQDFIPIVEPISSITNILNTLYIFAGQKGNIYFSNGYSISPLIKIPDYLTSLGGASANGNGLIDPIWTWGGTMTHRKQLWFQLLGQDSTNAANTVSIICSLDVVTNSFLQTTGSALNVESQNSFGLVSSTTTSNGLLIDNTPSANGNDSYYSAWANGVSSAGGIDYNNTTPWGSGEPIIETDIIPVGTFLQNKTFSSAEFKLDQPLASGDSISLYIRPSLSDSYTLLGTTTTAVLSNITPSMPIQNMQWAQFKVVASCASSNSSRIRLRQIRIR